MSSSRIVAIAVVATVSLVASLARHDRQRRARSDFEALESVRSYRPSVRSSLEPRPIVADPAPSAHPRLDAEVSRMCRGIARCLLDGPALDTAVAACVSSLQDEMAEALDDLASVDLGADALADELAAKNARCEKTCPTLSCYEADDPEL